MKNFAEPPQTFFVTPAVRGAQMVLSYLKVDLQEIFLKSDAIVQTEIDMTAVIVDERALNRKVRFEQE
jgi:hypothetical protein